jgi:hypothetical protein
MKSIITWYNKADQLVKEAGAIQADIATRITALTTWEAQMDFVASKVAPAVAQRTGAVVVRTRTGGVSFDKPDGTRDSTALSALRYWCAGTNLFAPSGSAAKKQQRNKVEQVTPRKTAEVKKLLAMFNDLSAAERAAFLAEAK